MKRHLKSRWMVLAASLVLTLSVGGAGYSGGHRGQRRADDNDNDADSSTATGSESSTSLPAATSPTY